MSRIGVRKITVRSLPIAAALLLGTAAHAETRSANSMPASKANYSQAAHDDHYPQGPKHGFPDNHGLERAREEANEHARFLRCDSEG